MPATAFSASKIVPGSKCNVFNQKVTFQNSVYTCKKIGNFLKWSKGVPIAKKTTPTIPETPTPTISAAPTSKPLTPLEEATSSFQEISRKSFNQIKRYLPAVSERKISIEYRYTENFPKAYLERWKSQLETTLLYLGLFLDRPQKAVFFFTTEKDRQYMLKTGFWNEVNIVYYEPKFKMWDSLQALDNCAATAAWFINDKPDNQLKLFGGVAISANPKTGNQTAWCDRSPSHEIFHSIQDYWLTDNLGGSAINELYASQDKYDSFQIPIFREGSTDAFTTVIVSQSYEEHFNETFNHYRGIDEWLKSLQGIKTPDDVVSYLQKIERRSNLQEGHTASYFLGNLFFEYMIARYELPKYIELVRFTSRKKEFREVFKSVYGQSLDSAYQEASAHILNGLTISRSR